MTSQHEPGQRDFPEGFLWGASTSAHQVEGGNINSDWWVREHAVDTRVEEPSGDANDSYHRFEEDMQLLAELGLNAYRFSIEWARIEPERGRISKAQLLHYRRMIDCALEVGLTPVVTLHHFTNPRWFAVGGGWRQDDAADQFGAYVSRVVPILGDVPWVCTVNEPNMVAMTSSSTEALPPGSFRAPDPVVTQHLIKAHHRARDILGASIPARTGWTVANQAYQPAPGCERETKAFAYPREDVFLEAATGDDFVGVQAYLRTFIGKNGPLPVPDGAETTLTGWEYFPHALGIATRHAWEVTRQTPILVTENGIATADDQRRIDYTRIALADLHDAITSGIRVEGYLHWSALDNYEWGSFRPTFGLISVDRETFQRRVKPSGHWLGEIARRNALVDPETSGINGTADAAAPVGLVNPAGDRTQPALHDSLGGGTHSSE